MRRLGVLSLIAALAALTLAAASLAQAPGKSAAAPAAAKPAPKQATATAIFAGGCFWCMEPPFDVIPGVHSTVSGYTGGPEKYPTYEQVSYGRTGHREAVLVTYDPSRVTYEQLLEAFWRSIDPTQAGGQFADIGPQYRTAIYYASPEQRRLAEDSKQKLAASGKFSKPIVVEILAAGAFYPAEEYHQDYYRKNPADYNRYKEGSGRGPFLRQVWGSKH